MSNWDIVAYCYNTTFTMFLFLLAILMFIVAYKGYKANNRYGGSSTLICGILIAVFGFYNLFIGLFLHPFNGFMVWWIGILFAFFISFALKIQSKKKKMELEGKNQNTKKDLKKRSLKLYIESMTKEDPYKDKISIKMEAVRKSFHLAGFLLFLAYFGFFFIPPLTEIANNLIILSMKNTEPFYNLFWGDIHANYPYHVSDPQAIVDLTLFALFCALMLAILSDLIRVMWGPEYSVFNFLTKAVLRKKEYNAAGPQIYLLVGVIFSYLLFVIGLVNILTVVTAILIACFSDALSALIGRRYGKHKYTCIGGDIKSWEGLIAGTTSAFLIGLIIIGPIYALIAAIIFLLIDYFPVIIADNLLNPIMITVGISFFYVLLGFPIGWF